MSLFASAHTSPADPTDPTMGLSAPTGATQRVGRRAIGWLCTVVLMQLAACGGGSANSATSVDATTTTTSAAALSAQAALGEKIFADASLSASGRQSCASCHVDAQSHAPDNGLAAQLGGPALDAQGTRSAPSIDYLSYNTAFRLAADGAPSGGFFWDGRATTLQAQAAGPFTNPVEMANRDAADLVAKLARASYADDFKRLFGADILTRPDDAMARIALALQQYQLEDAAFRPFSSKFDAFLGGTARLSEAELRGLSLFNNPAKGNCSACHPSTRSADGRPPLFTDFSYDNLGVPRNRRLAANADPAYFDLGLCGRPELAQRTDLCGAFKVPSLRNVAKRRVFFHNGRFDSLTDVVSFYAQRDTQPEKWYPRLPDGTVNKFDDLPAAYRANVNTTELPYTRRLGDEPALSEADIADVVAFLRTLSDGYQP